jgi:ribonuclease BN (tRNA processing enzyme)
LPIQTFHKVFAVVGTGQYQTRVRHTPLEVYGPPGIKDGNVNVTAFNVNHGEWGTRAFGYRFQTADRTIVISGDTSPSDSVVEQCNGCDVLIHEVYTEAVTREHRLTRFAVDGGRRDHEPPRLKLGR